MRASSSGVSEAKSRASRRSVRAGMGLSAVAFDDDLAEELALLGADPPETDQLQHREQGDHDLGAAALAPDERREQERPRVAEQREDLGHPLEDRGRVGLDLAGRLAGLLLDRAPHRPLGRVARQALERALPWRWQGARRATPEERLLRLSRPQPRAEGLHARVRAQPLLELEPKRLALLVQRLGLARIGRHEQLGLEVDERRGHHQVRAGGLEVAELDRLEVHQVLVGDRPHRQPRQVDLVGAAEVEQQVERALEGPYAEREVPGRLEGLRRVRRHGVRFTAARTSSIVACATARARLPPSCKTSTITSGRSANFWRRSRMPSSLGTRWRSRTSLQSRHPIPAVRHPVAHASRSAAGVKILCRSNTGQMSGLPGSVRRWRAGSVTIGRTLRVMVGPSSARSIVLLYDFDIFRPSVPGTFGISVSFTSGSGNTSRNEWLNRRATSRVSSTWGA